MKQREIKFRGKRIDNGEWVKGYLYGENAIIENESEYIVTSLGTLISGIHEVLPETVGQLIGDLRSGNEIYEGDVCECDRYETHEKFIVHMNDIRFVHEWARGSALNSIKVIGNEHDNPEMIQATTPKHHLAKACDA